jgi:hypothetical protein
MHFHVFSLTGMIPSLESKVSNVKSFLNFWSRISSLECLEFLWIWMYLIFEYGHSLIINVQDNWYEAECSHIVSTLEPLGNYLTRLVHALCIYCVGVCIYACMRFCACITQHHPRWSGIAIGLFACIPIFIVCLVLVLTEHLVPSAGRHLMLSFVARVLSDDLERAPAKLSLGSFQKDDTERHRRTKYPKFPNPSHVVSTWNVWKIIILILGVLWVLVGRHSISRHCMSALQDATSRHIETLPKVAYLLPLLERMRHEKMTSAHSLIILVPTRELCKQAGPLQYRKKKAIKSVLQCYIVLL